MQDRYTDIHQLVWPDIEASNAVCEGGPIEYVIDPQFGITDEWLCQYVTPSITCTFGAQVSAILGQTLLWAAFDPVWQEWMNASIKHWIVSAFI